MSFEWGLMPHQVASGLLERDFAMLLKYAERRMLPTRRIQLQLARLCQITAGDATKRLGDFLFDPPENEPMADEAQFAGETIASMGGGRVFVIGQKKKRGN